MSGVVIVSAARTAVGKLGGSLAGLPASELGALAIRAGDADVVVAGSQENMSASPHVLPGSRDGWRMGDVQAVDTMIRDGLWDAFNGYHMGTTAENVARQHGITREQQDAFAVASQNRAEAAQKAGRFQEEIVPVMVPQRKGAPVAFATDEFVRHGVTLDAVASLKPAFAKDGSVTAGNASGLNDGAAALVVMSEARAVALGLEPLARIRAHASAGLDPAYMGLGPVPASRRCLERAGWGVDDLDLMEINEAFAAQACAVNQQMGWDAARINVNGGAIAIGHPIGASGARILVTLLHEMRRRRAVRGLASLCIGGGMGGIGTAICQRLCRSGFKVIAGCGPGSPRKDRWLAEHGPADVLVNNAGITRDSVFRKMTNEQWHEVIETNLNSLFHVTKQVIDDMLEKGWGRIINISSVNGQKGQFGQPNDSTAKAGIHGFTTGADFSLSGGLHMS
jgi:acetyl-CoA C-acetyltransferase